MTMSNLIIREMPQSINSFLRFQVGVVEKRKTVVPIYNGRRFEYYMKTDNEDQVMTIKGWGETFEQAERMAGVKPAPKERTPDETDAH